MKQKGKTIISAVFKAILILLVIEGTLSLGYFLTSSFKSYQYKQHIKNKGQYRIFVFGDSVTAKNEGGLAYPKLLEKKLNSENKKIKVEVINFGLKKANSFNVLDDVKNAVKKHKPDMVMVMMGVNDKGEKISYKDKNISKIISILKSTAIYKVVKFISAPIKRNIKTEISKNITNKYPKIWLSNLWVKKCYAQEAEIEEYIKSGWLYKDKGELSAAESIFIKATRIDSSNEEAYLGLGWVYLDLGEILLSKETFERVIEINPKNYNAYNGLGWLYSTKYKKLNYSEEEGLYLAKEMFKKAKEINQQSSDAYAGLGWVHHKEKNYIEAKIKLKEALEINPNNFKAYLGLGWVYRDEGNHDFLSEMMFKKALDINPTSYESYLGLGWVYKDKENVIRRIKAKDKKPSKKMFEEALEIDPKNYQAYMGLGWVYKDEGKIDLSVEMFKKAIKIKPNDIDAYLSLGWMYYEMGEYISAEKIFIKARAIDPEDPEPYIGLGAIYQNFSRSGASKEKIKKAEGFFKKAVTQGNLSAYKYLGSVYLDRLNFILAEESYKKAVQNQPYDYEIYNGLGTIYLKQEKFQEAEDNFLKAIQLNINNEKGYLGLNSVYEKQGKSAMAETVLSQAARLSNDEFPYAKLAIVYHKKGQQGLSERYFKKANEMRMNYYVRGTKNNYNRLKDLLKKENIKFVVLGYPLREIDYVRKIVGENKNVTFVNNGPIFKEKITKTNVSKYFSDMFGGDTGVLTVQGMEVLAENIANQIKKIFY